MASVHFDGISHRRLGEFDALSGFDLDVEDGELVALAGSAGSGASTALRLLAGLEDPHLGTIRIGDRDVSGIAPRDRRVALVLPHHGLYPDQSVADHFRFPLVVGGAAEAVRERRVTEVAEQLDLTAVLGRRPGELTVAQRHRVAIGRAIVRRPDVLLMDEPLGGLDADDRATIRDEIVIARDRLATTTLAVIADRSDAIEVAHRTVNLDRGRAAAARAVGMFA